MDGAAAPTAVAQASEDTTSSAQRDLLYEQIGRLKVEHDFLSRSPAMSRRNGAL